MPTSLPFEILEHTADIGLRARGTTPEELFENAAAGLLEIALDRATIAEGESRSMAVEGADRESLLVNWLQEFLWLLEGEAWVARRVAVQQISPTAASGTVYGEPRNSRHRFRIIIKAITYHQLSIREQQDGWVAEVYVDI